MAKASFYFHYQVEGKESAWKLALATERAKIIGDVQPAFTTVLDLSAVPDDNDWTKVRYKGPFYADFDADGDIELVCAQFGVFLGKLTEELDFDVTQARMYASGGKGFHIEIPQECFLPKVPETGITWLPYVYRAVAEQLMVDTLDLNVYTGKRGRQWRTTNVQRENGNYKVPLTLEDALAMTPELYAELVSAPRAEVLPTPPSLNVKFSMLFERAKEKTQAHMRGKKKRQEKANAVLEPWKKAKQTPPSIQRLMDGENIADGIGFQMIAMQLAIYATSVGMSEDEFVDRCNGLVLKHKGDGTRYAGADRRKGELRRMWEYMAENSLYDFEIAPIVSITEKSVSCADLGIVDREDPEEAAPKAEEAEDTSDSPAAPVVNFDHHRNLRKGFVMNGDGMFVVKGDNTDSISRATIRNVVAYYDLEDAKRTADLGDTPFKGYEFDIVVKGQRPRRGMLSSEAFTSSAAMKKFFAGHQISFQGGDAESVALMDILAERANRSGKTYVYPREGFFIVDNPEKEGYSPVMVYLTKDTYLCGLDEADPHYFRLKYRPNMATSSYNIDIHQAPDLTEDMKDGIHDLFSFSRNDVLADLIGWFVACHYRSLYLKIFRQFPLLQIYGEAGSGKSQTVMLLSHLHWCRSEAISLKSAAAFTPFALDMHASSSTSAPFIVDEYKPRELRKMGGKYEKVKDVFKASYIGADIGERGTVNKGAENHLALIKSKATAPIVFMGESIEMETAIIERSVIVQLAQSYVTRRRRDAFFRLQSDPTPLSAIGRRIVENGFGIDMERMKDEFMSIRREVEKTLPDMDDDTRKRAGERLIFNRVLVLHGLTILKRTLREVFENEFDEVIDQLMGVRVSMDTEDDMGVRLHAMSEISKVINRIALLSRAAGRDYEVLFGKDYLVGPGWVEIKVERTYDCYRRYCSTISEVPLFDNLEGFVHALNAYSAVVDRVCARSELRDGSSETIIRLDTKRLTLDRIQQFRS